MPAYGTPQSGGLRQCGPGEFLTLFDGTEANQQMASIAFARGYSGGQSQVYTTFYCTGLTGSDTVDVQASNSNVDADFFTIGTMAGTDASPVGDSAFTDSGSPRFYRVLKSGGQPVVTVQR